jgi:hypothetical protein
LAGLEQSPSVVQPQTPADPTAHTPLQQSLQSACTESPGPTHATHVCDVVSQAPFGLAQSESAPHPQVVPELQTPEQQPKQIDVVSPRGTHVTHEPVLLSHGPPMHTLGVHVSVWPQLSVTLPPHWFPQAKATDSGEQQSDVVVSQTVPPVQRLDEQATVLPQLSLTVPVHCEPHAMATVSGTQVAS